MGAVPQPASFENNPRVIPYLILLHSKNPPIQGSRKRKICTTIPFTFVEKGNFFTPEKDLAGFSCDFVKFKI